MEIRYYMANSPADAFEAASKAASDWTFAELEALGEMAKILRGGFTPTERLETGKICACNSGSFLLFDSNLSRGYGIALVQLRGHECGVDDPVAQEILEFHRSRRGQEFFADQLLVWSKKVANLADLDRGYRILQQAGLVELTEKTVTIKVRDGEEYHRPAFVCR